jgi:hypothetical protein
MRAPADIDADIAKVTAALRTCRPEQRRRLRYMLECLYAEAIGASPPPEPPDEPPQGPSEAPASNYDRHEWLRVRWDYIQRHPCSVQEWKPKHFDPRTGRALSEDEHGRPFPDDFEWGPQWVLDEATRFANARCGRPDGVPVDRSIRWEATYSAIEDRRKAELGSDWNRPGVFLPRELPWWER